MFRRAAVAGVVTSLLAVTTPAQDFVSPSYHRDFRGNAANDLPFGGGFNWPGTIRYQQIHDDLRGVPMTIRSLSFRPHEDAVAVPAGTVDFELWMGDGDRATAGNDVAANYLGSPSTVVARRIVSLPARGGISQPFVEPWDITIPLDAPYAHSGSHDLVWESRAFARTGGPIFGGFFGSDYAVQSTGYTVPNQAQSYSFGPACAAGEIGISAPIATLPTGTEMTMVLDTRVAPGDNWAGLLLGLRNPAAPVPTAGCVTDLYTDGLTVVLGNPDRNGVFFQSWTFPWLPSMADGEVYVQGVSFRINGPATLTRGLHLKLPPGPSPRIPAHQVICTPVTASTGLVPVTPQQVIVRFGT